MQQQTIEERHKIVRVRRETQRRSVSIARITELTPGMRRLTLGGDDLAGFESASYDDHIKLFFTDPSNPEQPISRNITPRRFDAAARTLDVDIALHDGPIANWARAAQPGAPAWVGGPRGSYVVPADFDWYLLVGDETALPAIGRRLEELPAGAHAYVIAEVADASAELAFTSAATIDITWLHRGTAEAGTTTALQSAVAGFTTPAAGDGYVWVACESDVAKAIRADLVGRGLNKDWLRVAAYWKRNTGDVHETLND
jgi:NADPH-dependent ferric siderophore reductase